MEISSNSTLSYWPKVMISVLLSVSIVLWFSYPAQTLFWFFALDVFIVCFYTLVQLIRFSSTSKLLLITGGLAILLTLIPLLLGSFAILVTQNVIQVDAFTTENISLIVPALGSLVTYFYITQSTKFATKYFDRHKILAFLIFTFGTLFFGSWVAYTTHAFSEAFADYYLFGFFTYLFYRLVFDGAVYHFFQQKRA